MTKLIGIALSSSNIEILVPLTPKITLRCLVDRTLKTKYEFVTASYNVDWNTPFTFTQKGWTSKEIEWPS